MFQGAVNEAGEGRIVADTKAEESFGVATWFEGADGVNDFSGGDALTTKAHEDDGR